MKFSKYLPIFALIFAVAVSLCAVAVLGEPESDVSSVVSLSPDVNAQQNTDVQIVTANTAEPQQTAAPDNETKVVGVTDSPRQCIEVVGLRRGGGLYIRNLSGTASAKIRFTPVSKQN